MTQHRIFLVSGAARVEPPAVRHHWTARHGQVFVRTPGLSGYVQNRPLIEEWDRLGPLVCSETWFADRDAERRAYSSAYYRDVVTPDEAGFLNREAVWSSPLIGEPRWPDPQPPYRVLLFGAQLSTVPGAECVALVRDVPVPGTGRSLVSIWLHDRDEALALAARADCLAIATEPLRYPVPTPRRLPQGKPHESAE